MFQVPHYLQINTCIFTRRYPVRVMESTSNDACSIQEHNKALQEELRKAKPRDPVILPLMKSTFSEWRIYMHNDVTMVKETLNVYQL